MSKLSATRYSFFKGETQTLRFAEHVPPKEECDHPICNCTRNVEIRPAGDPLQVTQSVTLTKDEKTEFNLSSGWLTFRWDIKPEDKSKCVSKWRREDEDEHAYFMFNPKQRSVKIEMAVPGYKTGDYFLANLYMGNDIDISRFYNGHSPSTVVDLSKISAGDVWLHENGFGTEAMLFFDDNEEARAWRHALAKMEQLAELMAPYQIENHPLTGKTLTWSVEDVLREVQENKEIAIVAESIIEHCSSLVSIFQTTDLFKLQQKIDQKIHPNIYKPIEELIDRSSLGTLEVKQLIVDVDPKVVEQILARSDEIADEAKRKMN
jgi:hypothetical protein